MWGSCYFNGSRNGISFISLNGRIIHVQSQSSCILALKEHRDMVESCLHMAVLLEQRQHVTMWQIPNCLQIGHIPGFWSFTGFWFRPKIIQLSTTKVYIYILCVCFCHPSSSYIPIVSRLVLFWSSFGRRKTRMTWSDKRSSLWAPHISRTLGQWRPPVFFGFGCWNLWWFYGILNHTTGRLLWIGYSDIWCYDAILVVLLRKASQPPSSLGNAAGNISCSQLDSRVV